MPKELRTENGNRSVGQLWDPTGGGDILDGWAPEALDPTIAGSRRFRYSVIALLLLLGVVTLLALLVLLVLPTIVESQARSLSGDYRQTLLELNADLAPTQVVLERATDPIQIVDDFSAASATLAALSETAATLGELGNNSLPSTLPLIPRDSLDELQPARARMVEVGVIAGELARRITLVIEYQTDATKVLAMPTLPAVVDEDQVNDLSVSLAAVQAETTAALATLPDDAAFATHKAMARAAQERLGPWQTEYLEALRTRDRSSAVALVNEMADLRSQLDTELQTIRGRLREELDGALITLAEEIEATLILLPR